MNNSFYPFGNGDMNMLNEMLLNNINNNPNNQANQTNMNNLNNISNISNNRDIAGTYEGYIRANMFNNLYDQYKNYKPAKLVPNNEQAELLLNINQTTFAAHDIRLYLDVHPDDRDMIRLFNEYQKQAMDAIKAYEKKYGPILADSPSEDNMFSWEAYSFPWEMEEM